MAGPLSTAAIAAAKHIAVDIVKNPENILKYFMIIFGIFTCVFMLFYLPIALIFDLPLISFESNDADVEAARKEAISYYKEAPESAKVRIEAWIEDIKKNHGYDSLNIVNDYSLDWRNLLAVDAVKHNQDFRKVDLKKIADIAFSFSDRSFSKETYYEEDTYYSIKRDSQGNIVKDKNGNPVMEPHTVTVERVRLNINVKTKSLEAVLRELNFSQSDFDTAVKMYYNMVYLNLNSIILNFRGY